VHFKLNAHLHRLEQSCAALSIPFPWTIAQLMGLCGQVSDRNDHGPGEEHRLLIVVSPGCAPMYKDLAGVIPHPFLYIADFPLRYTVAGFAKYFTEGVHCVTSKIRQVSDTCVPSAAKHRSRLHFHLAQMQAPAGTWALLRRDGDLHYCEAPGANLAYVRNGEVQVVSESALPGISLRTVQDLTKATVGSLYPDMRMTELWLTGTPFCMIPVVSLDGKPIGTGTPGPVFQQTVAKWSALVGLDIQEQMTRWDSQA